MRLATNLNVTVKTSKALSALRESRSKHKEMLDEARSGYIDQAREVILKRLDELKDNKAVNLSFDLRPPRDNTAVYDTAIQALEMHTEDTIRLSGDQVRFLLMNEWDWIDEWIISNHRYSGSIKDLARAKGLI